MDIDASACSPADSGPCLFRRDYERQPPATWSRLRREIGWISFDASLADPPYSLTKAFKRFVHLPADTKKCTANVYEGYSQFIEQVKSHPDDYFRSFDSTDLRPLLSWYSRKQNLFSSTHDKLLKPPTFICRRLVLRTLLANLYCDSEPWKLLVVRIKGQFYLALANRATKRVEDMTQDEYSGYCFEALFTTKQPNTTRHKVDIPLQKPQEQFHSVQYWQFGEFNLLYSNEIDAEIRVDTEEKQTANNDDHTNDHKLLLDPNPSQSEQDAMSKAPSESEHSAQDIERDEETNDDVSKQAQINENLQLTGNEESEAVEEEEKKKRVEGPCKSGYVEMKCTNKKIFYRDANRLQTLSWWAQMWLAKIDTLMLGYKGSTDGSLDHIDLLSIGQLTSKFLGKYDLHLKYCLSYLHSFLRLVQRTVLIDDPNTIHAFAYIPQPLDIDPLTGQPLAMDLPQSVPFRYTQLKRSNRRHAAFMPQWYIDDVQRTIPLGGFLRDEQLRTVDEERKKRIGHRGRASCPLRQQANEQTKRRKKRKGIPSAASTLLVADQGQVQ